MGTVSTVILQSGTAASVIVANLADAGLISFYNTLGVLFGLNIGASITSQLIAFNFMFISPFIILLGLIICWWGGRLKKYGKPVFYFGLLFFSIYLISMFFSMSSLFPIFILSFSIYMLLGKYLAKTAFHEK